MDTESIKRQNPWWSDFHWEENDIHLKNLHKEKIQWNFDLGFEFEEGIFSVRGPRQVGKTTWIKQTIVSLLKKHIAENIFFYSFDNTRDNKELEEIILFFLELHQKEKDAFLFLDEIPYVQEWQKTIKHLYDEGLFQNCCVVISGSHSIDIARSIEMMPGRGDSGKRHFIMFPLTFYEYLKSKKINLNLSKKDFKKDVAKLRLNFKEIQKEYENYLLTGGFLKIINEFERLGEITDSSYDIYLKWIIGDLSKWGLKEDYAKQIVKKIYSSYTSTISWSNLHKDTDIDSHVTIQKYVLSLEEMYFLEFIYKMDYSKKIADFPKSKKIYFSDPFLYLCSIKWTNSMDDFFTQAKKIAFQNIFSISEGVVLNNLINSITKRSTSNIFDYKDKIFSWHSKSKNKEIDFIIKNTALEIKYQENIGPQDYKALSDFKNYYLLTKDKFDKNTLPVSCFLILLEIYFDDIIK